MRKLDLLEEFLWIMLLVVMGAMVMAMPPSAQTPSPNITGARP